MPVAVARLFEMPGPDTSTPADMDLAWQANCLIIGLGATPLVGWLVWPAPMEEPVPLFEADPFEGVSCRLDGWPLMLLLDITSAVEAGEALEI